MTFSVTARSDGVQKEKTLTRFETFFRLYMVYMIPKAIESRHNVKPEVEIGKREVPTFDFPMMSVDLFSL